MILLLVLGCVAPFETPSAYDDEQLLCGDDDAFQSAFADCQERDCVGVMSAAGVLEDSGFALNTDLAEAVVRTREDRIDRVDLYGTATYFQVHRALDSLGILEGSTGQVRDLIEDAERLPGDLNDAHAGMSLHLAAVYQTLSRIAQPGTLRIEAAALDEITLAFEADFDDGEWLEGCAQVRSAEIRTQ